MKLRDIKLNSKNPRLIRDDKFRKLVYSIRDFPRMMELRPIIVNKDMVVLGGNMRLRACRELGYKEIPDSWVKVADALTQEEERRFIIEDNVGFGEWDWDMIANEWDADTLKDWGLDVITPDLDLGDPDLEEKEKGDMVVCPKCGFEWKR